jgi:hypothetical protein
MPRRSPRRSNPPPVELHNPDDTFLRLVQGENPAPEQVTAEVAEAWTQLAEGQPISGPLPATRELLRQECARCAEVLGRRVQCDGLSYGVDPSRYGTCAAGRARRAAARLGVAWIPRVGLGTDNFWRWEEGAEVLLSEREALAFLQAVAEGCRSEGPQSDQGQPRDNDPPRLRIDLLTQTVTLDGDCIEVPNPKALSLYKALADSPSQPLTRANLRDKLRDKVPGVKGNKTIPNLFNTLPPRLRRTVKSGPEGYWIKLPPPKKEIRT